MTSIDPDAILHRVRKTNDPRLSDVEVAALETRSNRSLLARRLLAMHYFRAGAYDRLVPHARALFEADPSPEEARNLLSSLRRAGLFEDALALAETRADAFDPIDLADGMCGIYARLQRHDEAVTWGRQALALKDAQVPQVERPEPVIRPFNPNTPTRNIISFSLFGNQPRYLRGALRNAIIVPHLYPGWTARFYVDESVPEPALHELLNEGAQIRKAPKLDAPRFGLFWRFLVEDDPDVDIYLVRDADSVLNIRERAAVEDWLASGKPYHVMRDHPAHSELILAGMWGAHRGNLEPMGRRFLAHVREHATRLNDRMSDQLFLRKEIWPLIRRDALVHDAWFNFGNAQPFRAEFTLPFPMHVGQNDTARVATPAGKTAG